MKMGFEYTYKNHSIVSLGKKSKFQPPRVRKCNDFMTSYIIEIWLCKYAVYD
jgi:hypothetical protein